jgi:RNA polymerase sigma factor for flagellar operon FliA
MGANEVRMILSETSAAETEAVSRPKSRDELILEHLPQVKLIAKRMQKSLPASMNLDDLISSGVVGLIAAVDRYDPKQEVKLKTYAEYKIRGAILDSLRMTDWAPREKRKRARLIEAATSDLEKALCRTPCEEEVASKLGLPVNEYQQWLRETHGLAIGSLDTPGTQENGKDLLSYLSASMEEWPSELFEQAELKRLLTDCIESMPQVERTVLSLYFYKEMTLRDIAKTVDLHESRISQLKSKAISRLKAHLQTYWPVDRSSKGSHTEQRCQAAAMR